MQEIVAIFQVFGPVAAPYVLFGWAYVRGHLSTGRETRQLEKAIVDVQTERDREVAYLQKRIIQLEHENVFWQDIAWSSTRITDTVVGALPKRKEPTT